MAMSSMQGGSSSSSMLVVVVECGGSSGSGRIVDAGGDRRRALHTRPHLLWVYFTSRPGSLARRGGRLICGEDKRRDGKDLCTHL